MKKCLVSVMIVIFVVSVLFVGMGCKKTVTTETTVAETTATETTAAATTAAETTEAAKKYEGITMRLLTQDGSSYNPLLQKKADEFFKNTGAKIEFDLVPYPSLQSKILTSIQTGEGIYDIFLQDIQFDFSIWPYLVPINAMLEKNNVDISDFMDTYTKFSQGFSGEAGVRYGLPLISMMAPIYYNTSMIDKIPDSWEEYFDLLKTNTVPPKYGSSLAEVAIQLPRAFMTRYWGYGQPLFTPDWKVLINSENGVKALENLKYQVSNFTPPGSIAWDNFEAAQAFINGDVATYEGWPGLFPEDPSTWKIGSNWNVSKYPEGAVPFYVEHDFVIFKTSKSIDAAFEYILNCTSQESEIDMALNYNAIPSRKSTYANADVLAKYPYLKDYQGILNEAKPLFWGLPQWLEMFVYLGDSVSKYLSGEETSAKKVLDDVAAQWTKSIEANVPTFEYHE